MNTDGQIRRRLLEVSKRLVDRWTRLRTLVLMEFRHIRRAIAFLRNGGKMKKGSDDRSFDFLLPGFLREKVSVRWTASCSNSRK